MKSDCLQKIFILTLLLSVYSCENPVDSNYEKYFGGWLWLKTEGGLFPRVITPEEGVTVKISFDIFNTYQVTRNDTLKLFANYSIEKAEHGYDKILFSNILTNNCNSIDTIQYAQVKENILVVWDGAYDGFFSTYKKQ